MIVGAKKLTNKKVKSDYISQINRNCFDKEMSKVSIPRQNILQGNRKESDKINEEMFIKLKEDINEDEHNSDETESDKEVFVCESDLGVGVDKQNTITQLRRQTLLKMISDPASYNRQFFKSLCFCNDLNRELLVSPEGVPESHNKTTPLNHRCTFSVLDYQSKDDM